jgi:hypothetical protein
MPVFFFCYGQNPGSPKHQCIEITCHFTIYTKWFQNHYKTMIDNKTIKYTSQCVYWPFLWCFKFFYWNNCRPTCSCRKVQRSPEASVQFPLMITPRKQQCHISARVYITHQVFWLVICFLQCWVWNPGPWACQASTQQKLSHMCTCVYVLCVHVCVYMGGVHWLLCSVILSPMQTPWHPAPQEDADLSCTPGVPPVAL